MILVLRVHLPIKPDPIIVPPPPEYHWIKGEYDNDTNGCWKDTTNGVVICDTDFI